MRFSPDGKWLAVISEENEVHVVRVTDDQDHPKRLQILPHIVELDRRVPQPRSQSVFKDYDRTIAQMAFSCDSSVLVASDLSGQLDSWVLEGNENLGAPAMSTSSTQHLPNGVKDHSDSDSDSSEDGDESPAFFGQHWTKNPSGHLLPNLDSTPLVLSFRPIRKLAEKDINNNADENYNRREQYRLWILTAKHQMLEVDVLGGRLSDWSRKNPTAVLPDDFKKILDRVMGAIWDVTEGRERIWLYGESFVCMMNMGVDLSDGSSSQPQKKRRKLKGLVDEDNVPKRRKLGSGAGGPRDRSRQVIAPDVVERYEDGTWADLDLNRQDEEPQEGEEESGEEDLQLTRVDGTDGYEAAHSDSSLQRKFWCTFKYRPILGMVALEDDMDMDEERPPEVVIVERPHWDVQKDSRGG
jgi:U3 small nucleolar RNA-associated protein 4